MGDKSESSTRANKNILSQTLIISVTDLLIMRAGSPKRRSAFGAPLRNSSTTNQKTAQLEQTGKEPGELLLFGSGLLVLGGIFRKELGLGSSGLSAFVTRWAPQK
jgi:hypothetical protein